jgi:hypothetical protein
VQIDGRQITVLAVRDSDDVIECGRGFGASTVDSAPISLRELFLSTVKEGVHNALV